MLGLDFDEKKINEQDSLIPNSTLTTTRTIIEIPTKANVDNLRDENEQTRRRLGLAISGESNDSAKNNHSNNFFDNELANITSITIKRDSISINDLAKNIYRWSTRGKHYFNIYPIAG